MAEPAVAVQYSSLAADARLPPAGPAGHGRHVDRVVSALARAIKSPPPPRAGRFHQQTGLPFTRQSPQMFIISSISGGAGSGMAIDMAYMIRQILRDLGHAEEDVYGILAHGAGRNPQGRDLAVGQCLRLPERVVPLQRLPKRLSLATARAACRRFRPKMLPSATLTCCNWAKNSKPKIRPGHGQDRRILYRNATTPAGAFAEQCRALQEEAPSLSAVPMVRTFGLCQLGFSYRDVPAVAVNELCQALVSAGAAPQKASTEEPQGTLSDTNLLLATKIASSSNAVQILPAEVAACSKVMGLAVAPVIAELQTLAVKDIGSDFDTYLARLLDELVKNHGCARPAYPPAHQSTGGRDAGQDSLFARRSDTREISLESVLKAHVAEMAVREGAAFATGFKAYALAEVSSPGGSAGDRLPGFRAARTQPPGIRSAAQPARPGQPARNRIAQRESQLREIPRTRFASAGRRPEADPVFPTQSRQPDSQRRLSPGGAGTGAVGNGRRSIAEPGADLQRLVEEFQRPAKPDPTKSAPTSTESTETCTRLVSETIAANRAVDRGVGARFRRRASPGFEPGT